MILRFMNMNWHFYLKSVCNWGHQFGRICRRSYKDSLWLAQCHNKRYPFTKEKVNPMPMGAEKFTLGQHVLHFNTQTPLRNARSPVGFGEMLANQSSRPGPTMKHLSSPIFQNRMSRSFLERGLCFRVRLSNSNSDESFENLLIPEIVEFRTPVML